MDRIRRGTDARRRQLEATRERLASYVLAARGLEDAGVAESRSRELLERGWREVRAALNDILGADAVRACDASAQE